MGQRHHLSVGAGAQACNRRGRVAGQGALAKELSRPPIDFYVIDVSFRDIADADERSYFENLPTSFALPPEAVERLRNVAGRVLRASPAYRRLVQAVGGTVAKPSTDALH